MAISKVVVVDGNNLIVRIDRGVAGRGVTDVEPVEIDGSLYLVFTFSDGTTETVGPVGTIQYIGQAPIVVTGSTISLNTVPVAKGGTGQVTANAAFNALAPTQTGNSGKYLKTDGTNSAWDLLDISTADITGVLPLANGGTASTTASGARTNLGLGSIATQNASSVAITGGTITGITDLAVADGGTGSSTAAGAMVNLLPSYTGNANKRLGLDGTATGLEWVTDGGGTVTSVDVSGGTTGLSFSGGPVTTSGTITLSGTLDLDNGGTGATTAAGARTNLNAANQATTITAGTGLSGGGDLSANRTINIANTTVTAGAFGSASNTLTATVNAQGQLTALAATPIAIANTQVSGLGTMSTQNSNAVTITGGSITGITDLAIADGGTGASNAADARFNLGLGSSAVLNAGVALGVATLDAGGTVPLSQIPASIQGGVSYQGAWNASTNTPTLVSSVGSKGYYYVVSVAGNTNLNGVTDWLVGDWAIYNGTAWQKIDNTDQVASVNGYTGVVVLSNTDVGAPPTSLTISAGTGLSGGGSLAANRTLSIANTTVTAAPYGTASAVPTFTVNGQGQLTAASNVTIAIANTQVSGLGTMSTQNANSVAITGGSITGITDLAVADGGTGASTAADARTNLSAAYNAITISAGTGLTGGGDLTANRTLAIDSSVVTLTGTQTLTNKTITSPLVNEILDTNGNEILGLSPTTSATDFLTVKNGIGVGVPLHVYADGSSASIGLHIQPKGSGLVTISDGTDFNKGIRFRSSGSAASAITLLDAVASAGRVVTLPDATTTLVGRDTTDTLTNKTINLTSNTLVATSAQLASAVTDETGSGSLVFATSPTLVTPLLGTPTSVTLTNATGLPLTTGVTGTLAIANGGTGQATANAAFNALAPSQSGQSGKYLTTDGTNTSWASNPLGTVTSVAASVPSFLSIAGSPITTSGTLAISLSGTALPTTSGGTGLTSFTSGGVVYASSGSALATGSALTFDGTVLNNTGLTNTFRATVTGGASYSSLASDGVYATGTDLYLFAPSTKFISFYAGGAEGLRLTSTSLYTASGINVGIGTSSAGSKLDVVRSATTTTAFDESVIRAINTGAATLNQRVDIAMRWQDGTYNGIGGISMLRESATARSGALVFSPIGSDGNPLAAMTLTSVGNVGIGTSTPDVFSRAYSGKTVGISSASGESALMINSSGTNVVAFEMGRGGSRSTLLYDTTTSTDFGSLTSKPLRFLTGGAPVATLGSTGNLGIGTDGEPMRLAMTGTIADSTYPLIKGTVKAPYVGGWGSLAPETTIGGYQLFTFRTDNGEQNKSSALEVYLASNTYGAGITGMRFITGGYNSTNGLEAMRINELQYVGIGSNNPQDTLHVIGRTRLSSTGTVNDHQLNAATALEVRGPAISAGGTTRDYFKGFKLALNDGTEYGGQAQFALGRWEESSTDARSSLVISLGHGAINSQTNADVDVMTLLSSGNVGVGISNPLVRLQTNIVLNGLPATSGTTQTNGAFRISSSGTSGIIDFGPNGSSPWIQATDFTDLSQTYSLLLNPNGGNVNIGIGNLLVGTTSLRTTGYTTGVSQYAMETTGYGGAQWFTNRADVEGTYLVLGKSRGTSVNSNVAVVDTDILGAIIWQGATGSGVASGAQIRVKVDGATVSSSSMPARMEFYTTPSGSTTMIQRGSFNPVGLFTALYGSYADPSLNSTGSNGLQVVSNVAYNDNSVHFIGSVQDLMGVVQVRASGLSSIPFYPNNGGGVGYGWTAMNPSTGVWTTSSGPTIIFTDFGTGANTYTVTFSGGGGTVTIQRTAGTKPYNVALQSFCQV